MVEAPVRVMAAKAALKEHWLWSKLFVVLVIYRLLGLIANCALVAVVLWWIEPYVMVIPFVLLWYLPAVFRTGLYARFFEEEVGVEWWQPWVSPFMYPILVFVADDFSWLRIHPDQRKAVRLHATYCIRVTLLLCIFPICDPKGGLGGSCRAFVNDAKGSYGASPLKQMHDVFDQVLFGSTAGMLFSDVEHGDAAHFLPVFWAAVSEMVISLSMLWVFLTICLVFAMWKGWLRMDQDEALMGRIDQLCAAVEGARRLETPAQCKAKLQELATLGRAEGGCNTIELASLLKPPSANPALVAVMYAFHMLLRLLNSFTYISSRTVPGVVCGFVLLGHILLTAVFVHRLGLLHPRHIKDEVWLSIDQGIFTPRLFELLKSDKGVLTLPAFIFSLSALPWTIYQNGHSKTLQAGMAVVQVLGLMGGLGGVGVFTVEQFDLGAEREGKGNARLDASPARGGSASP